MTFLAFIILIIKKIKVEEVVLVCSGCHNKVPQTGWFNKQEKFIFSHFSRLDSQCQHGWFLLRPVLGLQRHLLCLHPALPPCVSVPSLLCKDTGRTGLGPP